MKTIFITGIHASGKGTLVKELTKIYQFPAYTVSDLIRNAGSAISDSDKRTNNIISNQNIWKRYLVNNCFNNDIIILDGHLALFDERMNAVSLDENILDDINLIGIISLETDVGTVQHRLLKRDKRLYLLEDLNSLLKTENLAVDKISKKLQVPVLKTDGSDIHKIMRFIDDIKD